MAELKEEILETVQQPRNHRVGGESVAGNKSEDKTEDGNLRSPFFLHLEVISAENLPVADITTSDPYVVVFVGGRFAGRTKTIKRNHRNPRWGESYTAQLLHRGSTLLLKVWDEDRGKDDDLMGTCTIKLIDIPLDKQVRQFFSVDSINNYNTSASRLELSILIKPNDQLIQIVKDQDLDPVDSVEDQVVEAINAVTNQFPFAAPSESVANTLKHSINQQNISYFALPEVRDLLCDVSSVTKPMMERDKEHYDKLINTAVFNRTALRLVNSTRLLFNNNSSSSSPSRRPHCIRHPPIEENCIQLNLTANESLFALIKFPNRLSLWSGARWLSLLYDIWHRQRSPLSVPCWAAAGVFNLHRGEVHLSDGRCLSGTLHMSFETKFRLFVDNGNNSSSSGNSNINYSSSSSSSVVELDSMTDMVISLDSVPPASYIMDVEVLAFSMDGEFTEHDKMLLDSEKEMDAVAATEGRSSGVLYSIGGNIKGTFTGALRGMTYAATGTVKGAKHLATGTAHVAAGTAHAVALGTVGAARTLATANPVKILETSGETLKGGIKGVKGAVVGASSYLTRDSTTHLMMKYGYFSQQVHSRNYDHFYIDWGSSGDQADADLLLRNRRKQATASTSTGTTAAAAAAEGLELYPSHDLSKSGVMVLCCHGTESLENIVGHRRLSAQTLSQRIGSTFEQPLNSDLGYSITLKSASGLQLKPPMLEQCQLFGSLPSSVLREGGIYAKIKFVDMHGRASGIIRQVDAVKSPTVAQAADVDFRGFNATFRARDGMEHAEYVRITLVLEDIRTYLVIGTAFVPLDYFQLTPTEFTFPLMRSKQPAVHQRPNAVQHPLGDITIVVQRLEEMSNSAAMIAIRPSLYECNLFNTRWYVECALSGSLDADSCLVEAGVLMANHDALQLIPEGEEGNFGTKRYELASLTASTGPLTVRESLTQQRQQQQQQPEDALHVAMHSPHQVGNNVNYKYRKESNRNNSNNGRTTSKGRISSDENRFSTKSPAFTAVDEAAVQRVLEVVVYENQRRQPYFPFDWSSTAYTRPQFSDFSFATAFKFETIDSALPPPGFRWDNNNNNNSSSSGVGWERDMRSLPTDPSGWMYGFRFGSILSAQKAGKSHVKPTGMHARRRKWTRRAVALQRGDDGYSEELAVLTDDEAMQLFAQQKTCPAPAAASSGGFGILRRSSAGGKSSTAATATAAAAAVPSWRKAVRERYSGTVIRVCQERASPRAAVLIPWQQVLAVTAVTASVLSITATIQRYFGEATNDAAGGSLFRCAEVELFVSNCPAVALKALIKERIQFARVKLSIQELVASGNFTGSKGFVPPVHASTEENDVDTEVPETAELSVGSEIVAELDDKSVEIEKLLKEIDDFHARHGDCDSSGSTDLQQQQLQQLQEQKKELLRRDCRLKLYTAALLGVGLRGNHDFSEEAVRAIIHRDYNRARNIEMDTPIATANNRIEFFLDIAEKRIRDAVLTGWNHRSTEVNQRGQLNRCLAMFANGYFVQVVSLLGAFFEENARVDMKGLDSKVQLITTYLKHNDRLAIILDNALRPFYMHSEPAAQLSLFLDFEILLSWYTTVLLVEMRSRVDDTLRVWTKLEVSEPALYKFPLPWIPQRAADGAGIFFSNIAEDLVEVLMTYVHYARFKRQTLASSLQQHIGKLHDEVCLSYTATFLYLAQQLQQAVASKDWAASEDEEELLEGATWLCSVANDAVRIVTKKYHIALRAQALKKSSPTATTAATAAAVATPLQLDELSTESRLEKSAVRKAQLAFAGVARHAMDHLSCIVFSNIFYGRKNLLTSELPWLWRAALNGNSNISSGGYSPAQQQQQQQCSEVMRSIADDLRYHLERVSDFLSSQCFLMLQTISAEKIVTFLLGFVKAARDTEFEFTEGELNQLQKDLGVFVSVFHGVVSLHDPFSTTAATVARSGTAAAAGAVTIDQHFTVFDIGLEILSLDLNSSELNAAMIRLSNIARAATSDAAALANFAEACFELRGIHVTEAGQQRSSKRRQQQQQRQQRSSTTSSAASHHSGGSTPASAAATADDKSKPQKRGSLLSSLFHFPHRSSNDEDEEKRSTPRSEPDNHHEQQQQHEQQDCNGENGVWRMTADDRSDSDAVMQLQLQDIKRQALASCLRVMVEGVRTHSDVAAAAAAAEEEIGEKARSIRKSAEQQQQLLQEATELLSPVRRIFSQQDAFSTRSSDTDGMHPLQQLILASAATADQAHSRTAVSSNPASPSALQQSGRPHLTDRLKGLFLGSNTSSNSSSGGGNSGNNTVGGDLQFTAEDGSNALRVTDLAVMNLFHLEHMFYSPHPFLILRLGNVVLRTRVVDTDTTTADWSHDEPIDLPLRGSKAMFSTAAAAATAATVAAGSSLELPHLHITLCYEGLINDHVVGSVSIPFAPYALPHFTKKPLVIADFSHNRKATTAMQRAQAEGRPLPSLVISVTPVAI